MSAHATQTQPRASAETRDHRSAANNSDPTADLTIKQWKFIQHYVASGDKQASAINAGYAAKSAHVQANVLLNHPVVVSAIEAEMAKSAVRCAVSQDSVLRGLVRESTYDGPGASHAARVRALELLGKTLSMFTDQSAIIGSDGKPIDRFAPVFLQVIRNG
jgi:hypothetical protein